MVYLYILDHFNPYRSAAMKIDTLGVDLSKVGIQLKFIRKNGSKNACSGE
jgi:hypothetical protein